MKLGLGLLIFLLIIPVVLAADEVERYDVLPEDYVPGEGILAEGYFISFKEMPILQKRGEILARLQILQDQIDLNKDLKDEKSKKYFDELTEEYELTLFSLAETLAKYDVSISKNQDIIIEQIEEALDAKMGEDIELVRFKQVFNGLHLNITEEDAEFLKRGLADKIEIHPNLEIRSTLSSSVSHIRADEAWNLQDNEGNDIRGEGVIVAIIDTGIDYTHSDFGACTFQEFSSGSCEKIIGGYDFINHDDDPMDDNGHGTHVASTVAGVNTRQGLTGVAPDAKILAYKVLNADGSGSFSEMIKAIERALDPNQDGNPEDKADVISMSLGAAGVDCSTRSPMIQAIDTAIGMGTVVVIAAGNEGPNPYTIGFPGCFTRAISVGANDNRDRIAGFSSRGPAVEDRDPILKPDVVAPGVNICAAKSSLSESRGTCRDSEHVSLSGTSMATPHVAGVVALIKQVNPNLNADEIKALLMNFAVDIDKRLIYQGIGEVDALKVVNADYITSPPTVFFGEFQEKQTQFTKEFVVKNLADTAKTFQLSYTTLPSEVELNLPETIVVAANSESSFDAQLTILDTISLETGVYYGKIFVTEEGADPAMVLFGFTQNVSKSDILEGSNGSAGDFPWQTIIIIVFLAIVIYSIIMFIIKKE